MSVGNLLLQMRTPDRRHLVTSSARAQPVIMEQPLHHTFPRCLTHYLETTRKTVVDLTEGIRPSENDSPRSVPAATLLRLRTRARSELREVF